MKWFKKETRAERNEKNFKKWLNSYIPKATNQRIELVRIFTDRNDNNWYILKNAGQLTKERSQRIEESMLAIEYGVSKQEIMESLKYQLKIVLIRQVYDFQPRYTIAANLRFKSALILKSYKHPRY